MKTVPAQVTATGASAHIETPLICGYFATVIAVFDSTDHIIH